MKKFFSKFHFLHKYSLVQQLIIVLCFVAIILVAVLMPLVDYNLNTIIDDQMYETLTNEQEFMINIANNNDSIMPDIKTKKLTYHMIYDSSSRSFLASNINSQSLIANFYSYLFGNDLNNIVKSSASSIEGKGAYGKETYYYRIAKYNDSYYLVSIVDSDYSSDLIASLRNQIIYIQYAFFLVIAAVLIIWVMTLISPLKKIKNYIDDIKEHKESELLIDREDEIGVVSQALVEMKEDLDKQEKIKEEMIHNISHDLKTPIALIQTYSQSVKDDIYPYGDKNSSMDIIIENADRLEHKVKSFLYLNRLDYIQGENNDLTSFDMKQLIEKVVNQMDAMKPHLSLLTDLQDVCFIGDEEHWRVAVENIIENASRYASSEIKIILKDKYLEIYNDGEHIDESSIPYLFDPYVKGVKGQFGLGLSIVSKVATMYGYQVEVKNQEVGVSFIFTKQDEK